MDIVSVNLFFFTDIASVFFLARDLVRRISPGAFYFAFTHLLLSFNFAFQTINFTDPFYAPPVVILTPKYRYNNNYSFSPQCNAVVTWVEVGHVCMFQAIIRLAISRKKP